MLYHSQAGNRHFKFHGFWGILNDHTKTLKLLQQGIGKGAILSPRHQTVDRLKTTLDTVKTHGVVAMVDPQLYNLSYQHSKGYPELRDQTIADLASYKDHWPSQKRLIDFQLRLGVTDLILPLPFVDGVALAWIDYLRNWARRTTEYLTELGKSMNIYATVPLAYAMVEDDDTRAQILNHLTSVEVTGYYLAFAARDASPFSVHLGDLRGQMDFVFRLKQNRYRVIMGYTSYSAVLLFPFGLDAFCSGGFGNRRRFDPEEWAVESDNDDEGIRRTPRDRYGSAMLLTSLVFPDEADLLYDKKMWEGLDRSPFASGLFDGQAPSSKAATWKQSASIEHYLWTCNELARRYAPLSRSQRVQKVRDDLEQAIQLQDEIWNAGVRLNGIARGHHLDVWRDAFNGYLKEVVSELEEEFL